MVREIANLQKADKSILFRIVLDQNISKVSKHFRNSKLTAIVLLSGQPCEPCFVVFLRPFKNVFFLFSDNFLFSWLIPI
jgi:hypothetical protein